MYTTFLLRLKSLVHWVSNQSDCGIYLFCVFLCIFVYFCVFFEMLFVVGVVVGRVLFYKFEFLALNPNQNYSKACAI